MFSGRLACGTTSVRPHVACKAGPNVNVNVARRVPSVSAIPRTKHTSCLGSLRCVKFRPNRYLLNGGISCMFLKTYAGKHVRSFHTFTSVMGKHGGTRRVMT